MPWYDQPPQSQDFGLSRSNPPKEGEEEEWGFWDHAYDIGMGLPRGAEGMAQDVYGLVDYATGDILPDWETRLLGESESIAGGIVEGISNFAAGFVPVVGWIGHGAKVGRGISLAKGLSKNAQKAAKAAGLVGIRGAGKLPAGIRAGVPKLGESGIDVTRAAIAGAITDFAVFDGHEARLSNLLVKWPPLSNSVTEFLAADESDTEIEGRLKAMLEGFVLGGIIDTFILAAKHWRRVKQKKAQGASNKEAQESADEAFPPDEIAGSLDKARSTYPDDPYSFARLVEDEDKIVTSKGKTQGTYSGTIGIEGGSGLTKPEQLQHIRNLVMMGAEQGSVGKEWYERSGQEILKLTGGNIEEADKIAQLVAIFSPQTNIDQNFERALQAYYRSKRMNKTSFLRENARINTDKMQQQAAKVLYDSEWLPDIVRKIGAKGEHVSRGDGRKISNFYNDLMAGIDPTRERVKGATMDLWMSRYFGFAPSTSQTGGAQWTVSSTQYDYMQRTTKSVADELGWEQHQAQSAIWSYAKTLWESMDGEVQALAKERGITGKFEVKTNLKYGEFFQEQFQRRLNAEAGSSTRFAAPESFDLSSLLRDRAIVLSDSAFPSPGSGILRGIHHASWEDKVQYLADMELIRVGDEGQDLIEEALGFGARSKLDPADQRLLPGPAPRKGDLLERVKRRSGKTEPVAINQAKAYAMVEGLYHGRGIVEGVQIFRGKQLTKKVANGFEIQLGRRRTDYDLEVIQNAVTKTFGRRKIKVIPLDHGFALVSEGTFKGGKFVDQARIVLGDLDLPNSKPSGEHIFADTFQIDSKSNDGSGFRALLEEQGHGESLERLDDVYGPNVTKLQQKYQGKGHGNAPASKGPDPDAAGTIKAANRAAESRRGPVPGGKPAYDSTAARLEDRRGKPVSVNPDGTITLYHRTDRESAQRILDTGIFDPQGGPPSVDWRRGAVYFSNLEHGAAHRQGFGDSVVSIKLDPAKVVLTDRFHNGEIHVRVQPENIADIQVIGGGRDLFTPSEIAATVKTSRPWKKTTAAQAARRIAPDFMPEGGTILDFGAGKQADPDKYYGKGLRDDGYEVTLYDFAENTGPLHNPEALSSQYDMVMASNVLNAQSSEEMLDVTLDQIARSANRDGRVIANLPGSPRKGAFKGMTKTESAEFLREKLLERFAKVERVGGTKAEPVFMASGKLLDPHTGREGLLNPRFEKAAPGIGVFVDGLSRHGYGQTSIGRDRGKISQSSKEKIETIVGLVQARYGGEVLSTHTATRTQDIVDVPWGMGKAWGERYHIWNRLADGTEIDLNSHLMGGNGWDPVVTEGTVKVLSKNELPWEKGGSGGSLPGHPWNRIRSNMGELDRALTKDSLEDPISQSIADSKRLDEFGELAQAHFDEMYPEGLTPADVAAKKRGLENILKRLRLEQFKIKKATDQLVGRKGDHGQTVTVEDVYKYQLGSVGKTAAQKLSDADIHILDKFMRILGEKLFEDVHVTIRKDTDIDGRMDFLNNILTITKVALQEGKFKETMLHEMWHHLSRYVDSSVVGKLKKQFEKERDAYFKKNPDAEQRIADGNWYDEEYRWESLDEWFAEVLSEKSLKKLELMDAASQSIFVFAKRILLEIVASVKSKFGFEHTQKILDDFFKGKYANTPRQHGGSLRHNVLPDVAFSRKGNRKRRQERKERQRQQAEPTDARVGLLRPLGVNEDTARAILRNVDQRLSEGFDLGINPREKVKTEDGEAFKYTKAELLDRHLRRSDQNLSHYAGPEDALTVLRTYEDLFRTVIEQDVDAIHHKSFMEQLSASREELGNMVATTSRDDQALQLHIQRGIANDARQLAEINARVLAYKNIQHTMGSLVLSDIKAYRAADGDSSGAMARIHFHAEFMANLTAGIKGLTSLQGRGLGSGNIPIEGVLQDPKLLDDFLQMRGGKKGTDRLVTLLETALSDGMMDAAAVGRVNRLVQTSFMRRVINVSNEYWINSILSGGKTLFINGLGGLLVSIYRPLESMLGASVTLNKDAFTDATAELAYLFTSAGDAFKMAALAFKKGENILDPGARVLDLPTKDFQAISPKGLGVKEDSLMGTGITWMGNLARLPSRILTSTDELFKQLNFRAKSKRALIREGMALNKTGDELASHVHDRLSQLVEDGQAYSAGVAYNRGVKAAHEAGIVDPIEIREFAQKYVQRPADQGGFDHALQTISREGLDVAEEVTFTRALDSGTFAAAIQGLVIRSPWMRFIIPFVRTPMNIAYFAGQRFDFIGGTRYLAAKLSGNQVHLKEAQNRMMRDLASGDPRKFSDAAGRASAGAMAAVALYGYAAQGKMTGKGPSDPELRQVLRDAGWQPYSFKTKEGYVSYNRVDPFATVMGTMADIHDHIRYSDMEDQEEVSTLLMGFGIALAENFTNKTYLAGLANILEALQQPDRFMPKLTRTYGASLIPFSSLHGQSLYAFGDKYMRDVQSMSEALMAKTPYYSDKVRPLRNFLGEPVKRTTALGSDAISSVMDLFNPISYTQFTDDTLRKEFVELGHGFTPPKPRKYGLDLTNYLHPQSGQDAFDRWQELNGSVRIGNTTLRSSLHKLIRSRNYQRLTPLSDFQAQSPRITEIKKVLERYKAKAFEQLMKEYPQLSVDHARIFNVRSLRKLGISAGGF